MEIVFFNAEQRKDLHHFLRHKYVLILITQKYILQKLINTIFG